MLRYRLRDAASPVPANASCVRPSNDEVPLPHRTSIGPSRFLPERRLVKIILAAVLTLLAGAAHADRITAMNRTDRCAYTTRLQVLAAYYFGKGTPRAEIRIHWRGDETPYEIDFINSALDVGYEYVRREHEAGRKDTPLELLGDRIYEACMSAEES